MGWEWWTEHNTFNKQVEKHDTNTPQLILCQPDTTRETHETRQTYETYQT